MFEEAVSHLRYELSPPTTPDDLVAAAGRLRHSEDPAAIITGTLIEIAAGNRLFAEVQAGRLRPEAAGWFPAG